MSPEAVRELTTNLACLLVTLVGMHVFNKFMPRLTKWLKHYLVYRHYPPEYAYQCVCGETWLMHEGDGGACTDARCHCKRFKRIKLEEQL
jgi:hypothetical protein